MCEIIKNADCYILIIGVEKTNRSWSDRIIKFCFDNGIEIYQREVEDGHRLDFFDYALVKSTRKTPIFANAVPMADVTDWGTYYLMKCHDVVGASDENLIVYFHRIFSELEYGVKVPYFSKTLRKERFDILSAKQDLEYDFWEFEIGKEAQAVLQYATISKMETSELTYVDLRGNTNIVPAILRLWHKKEIKNLLIHYGKKRTYFYGNKTMCDELVRRYGGVYSPLGDKAFCYLLKQDGFEKISKIISGMQYAV